MDWRTVDFDWNRARAFLVSAEEGSFSAAARALGSTQPTIGRQVAALERELQVTLFERVGIRLELTQTGVELLEHVRAMGVAATRVSLAATGQSESIEGSVSITASEAISAYLLPPVLRDLRVDHPGIEVELVVSNEARDLHRREADIAIRNFQPVQPDLFARRLRDVRAGFFASSAYVAAHGPLESAADMARVEIFAFDRTNQMIDGLAALGLPVERSQFPIASANHLVQWALCQQGVGICMMMEEVGALTPGVVQVFSSLPGITLPMWLVCHRELHTSRRIRLVFDRLAVALGAPASVR